MDWTEPCCSRGKISRRVACAVERRAAPPDPWMIRQRTSSGSEVEIPHRNDAMMNRMMDPARYRLRPNRDESQAVIGRTITLERMYPVATQPISSRVAPRLPPICGRATLTMVVSSTSRMAAVMRPTRMIQR